MKAREKKLTKKLRYTLKTVVDLEPADAGEIADIIEHNRELGFCDVIDIQIVEVEE